MKDSADDSPKCVTYNATFLTPLWIPFKFFFLRATHIPAKAGQPDCRVPFCSQILARIMVSLPEAHTQDLATELIVILGLQNPRVSGRSRPVASVDESVRG
jgi:hypothetical protein